MWRHVVMQLMQPYIGVGYNVTIDIFSPAECGLRSCWRKKTSVVGTIRVNRLEIPPFVKLPLHESVFYSSSSLNSTVYQAKHIKSVLILSMLHSGAVSSCLANGADTLRPNNKIMWPFAGNIALVNTMKSNARLWWKRVNLRHHRNSIIIMWPSSLGGAAYCVALCLSVRLSVCLSVRLSVRPVIISERHVAPPRELQWHTCTFRHALRAAYRTAISAAQILVIVIIINIHGQESLL